MSSDKLPIKTLTGKVALVTGSGRGIGHGIALELGQRGASVVVNYAKTKEGAESLVKKIEEGGSQAIAIQADISKTPEVKRLFEEAIGHYGRIDVVCSNAGTEVFSPEEEVTEELYDRVFALNTRAQFFVAQQAYIHLQEGGRIILMSSVAATMSGVPNHALYAGSKAAVEGFTRSFAKDCGHKRITVNAIAPGGVKSDMFQQNAWHYSPGGMPGMDLQKIEAGLASLCPLGRVAVPQDIGRIVAFLAHSDSEWINGQVILLTGGSGT
ncbi:Short chain dehydrogenase mdpC [Lachnellula suecica]|uniref:Short chain dehydrogenase mdpC n=1 Tax=Lachnellula suecica TaxID=602035 RepID=A0A8T9CCS8_9HELO|nr:Short chain dehydrogenase mdpC [Lachnellula suecica]